MSSIQNELEVKGITDAQKSSSYFDLHIAIDKGGRLKTKLYDKIFQQHLRIMLTFQDSYVVRGLALSTMFF
jgi:hypothetical protein